MQVLAASKVEGLVVVGKVGRCVVLGPAVTLAHRPVWGVALTDRPKSCLGDVGKCGSAGLL